MFTLACFIEKCKNENKSMLIQPLNKPPLLDVLLLIYKDITIVTVYLDVYYLPSL